MDCRKKVTPTKYAFAASGKEREANFGERKNMLVKVLGLACETCCSGVRKEKLEVGKALIDYVMSAFPTSSVVQEEVRNHQREGYTGISNFQPLSFFLSSKKRASMAHSLALQRRCPVHQFFLRHNEESMARFRQSGSRNQTEPVALAKVARSRHERKDSLFTCVCQRPSAKMHACLVASSPQEKGSQGVENPPNNR